MLVTSVTHPRYRLGFIDAGWEYDWMAIHETIEKRETVGLSVFISDPHHLIPSRRTSYPLGRARRDSHRRVREHRSGGSVFILS